MTAPFYRVDPYRREFDATVTKIGVDYVILDGTCFFPQGGGQAGDTGLLAGIRIINTLIDGEDIRHVINESPMITPGQLVRGVIDWERRLRIMRLHSAAHLVYYAMQEEFGVGCRPASSGMLDEKKDRSDYVFNKPIDREKLAAVADRVNQLIVEGLPITHEPGSDGRLLWKVAQFPAMECGGTHVRNTDEIGRIALKRGSKPGKGRERIELTLVG